MIPTSIRNKSSTVSKVNKLYSRIRSNLDLTRRSMAGPLEPARSHGRQESGRQVRRRRRPGLGHLQPVPDIQGRPRVHVARRHEHHDVRATSARRQEREDPHRAPLGAARKYKVFLIFV